jgi:hypothetical protein
MGRLPLLLLPLLLLSLLPPACAGSSIYTFRATYTVTNTSPSPVEGWVEVFAFDNENLGWGFQRVLEESFSAPPQESRTGDNRVLRFSLGRLSPGGSAVVSLTQILRVSGVRWENLEGEGGIPQELLGLTSPVPSLWEDAPELRERAEELRGETPYQTARNLFEFVRDYLTYFSQAANQSALQVYRSRVGKCTEFSNLFIALARLSGLPAKFLAGYGYNPEWGENAERMGHAFVALYLPGAGWVPVDETWRGGQFGELSEDHLLLFSSDGSNLVREGKFSVPGERWSGGTRLDKSLLLYREAAVEVRLEGAVEGDNVRLWATVRNAGRSRLENLRVTLSAAENAFAPFQATRELDPLDPGQTGSLPFSLRPLRGLENFPLTAEVRGDSPYGGVSSESTLLLTVAIRPSPSPSLPLLWILLPVAVALLLLLALRLRR